MKRFRFLWLMTLVLFLPACIAAQPKGQGDKPSQGSAWQEQYDLGVRYLSEGNYQEAIIAFTAAIEIDPKQAPAYVGRGDAYVLSGETEENLAAAKADYETAIELDETIAEAYLGLADVYIRQGDYDKALEMLRQGLEKTNGDQEIATKIAAIENGTVLDSSGNIRRRSTYDGDGNLIYWFDFTFDQYWMSGTQITSVRMSTVTSYSADGKQLGYIDLAYDSAGRQIVGFYSSGTGELAKIENEYDEEGNLLVFRRYGFDGALREIYAHEYNSARQLIRTTNYDQSGSITDSFTFEYGSVGQVVRETRHDPSGNITGFTTYDYDSAGNMIKTSIYGLNGELQYYDIGEYDSDRNLQKMSYYNADGSLISYIIYHQTGQDEYDADGNLIRSDSFD